MSVFTIRVPDDLDPAVRKAAESSGLSLNAYVVRTLRREAVREAAAELAAAGYVPDLDGEGDLL
jgi:predicted HicB family RNase H-like nuclease